MRCGVADVTVENCGDRVCFPAQSSVLDEQALLHRVVSHYDLPPGTSCRFLTRGDSDVYRIERELGTFYLKVRRPPVTESQCEAEARLLNDLADAGLPVVCAARRRDGRFASAVTASEGVRAILIFQSAPPPLRGPLDLEQARQLGELLARMHIVADARAADERIPGADLGAIERAVADVIAAVELTTEQCHILRQAAGQVIARYESLPRTPPAFGIVHGDLAPSNIRVAADGTLWLFDFGAFGRGWRLNELLNAKIRALPSSEESWLALRDGYASGAPFPAQVEEFETSYRLSNKLRMMGYICNALTLRRGIEPIEEFDVAAQVEEVRQLLSSL